jgi:SAM-dependent methyltransferase
VSVAQHLKIRLADYDRRIRTFIPHYPELLAAVASAVELASRESPTIVDLGIGTGALAARCLRLRPRARLIGIDADPEMLAMARRRLSRRARGAPRRTVLIHADFSRAALPPCDVIVATLALHHIASVAAKRRLYAKCHAALRRGGVLATGDCFLAEDAGLSRRYRAAWRAHLNRFYRPRQTRQFFQAWAHEDNYFPLTREWEMLQQAGFEVELLWRLAPFGVLLGRKTPK